VCFIQNYSKTMTENKIDGELINDTQIQPANNWMNASQTACFPRIMGSEKNNDSKIMETQIYDGTQTSIKRTIDTKEQNETAKHMERMKRR